MAASASSSRASVSRCIYDVVLSSRWADTSASFTDFLQTAMEKAGIHAMEEEYDDQALLRSDQTEEELQRARTESRLSVVIFSKNYAASEGCLDSLVWSMERARNEEGRYFILPVFYDVDPSEVRKQSGDFGEAFSTLEIRFGKEADRVQSWRRALKDAADLGGMVLGERHQAEFIQGIILDIGKKLNQKKQDLPSYLVGIDSRVQELHLWLQDQDEIGITTISGLPGIGKTTIAKKAYNMNRENFEASSFIANIRESVRKSSDSVHMHKQLLSDILNGKEINRKIYSPDDGIMEIQGAISRVKRVLIVFDDVDDLDIIAPILEKRNLFFPGSKIIITTRRENLLNVKPFEDCKKFKVKELNEDEALQLFKWHAFGEEWPLDPALSLSTSIVQHCGGLPSALQALGTPLCGKGIKAWESELMKLEAFLDGKILQILRQNYDALPDDHTRKLFVEIACDFIGKDEEIAISELDRRGYHARIGIEDLFDRCLLSVTDDKKLSMPKLLITMGKKFQGQEDPSKSRTSNQMDISSVFQNEPVMVSEKRLIGRIKKVFECITQYFPSFINS